MPANLPPQYYELERQFKAERDLNEKLRMAQELLRIMPKHKGTDKLQGEMKAKISKLKQQIQSGGNKSGASTAAALDHVEREGAGQVVLIGPPNSGKSSILDIFTNANPIIADYPFSTREPQPGMMSFETIHIQLIDTPPISPDLFETYLLGIIRNADLIAMVVGVEDDGYIEATQFVLDKLAERKIQLAAVEIAPEQVDDAGLAAKRAIVIAHKIYDDDGNRRQHNLDELFPGLPIIETSILDDDSLEALRRAIFENLNIIRVFTKNIGHDPDFSDPIILKPGATVEDAAIALHKDFAYKLQYAKIWGEGKHDGQKVQKTFELIDGDIIEFHI